MAIHVGDVYFNRRTDFTILCMPCWEARQARWREMRDTSEREHSLLEDIRDQPRSARELQEKYGALYVRLFRKLRMKGYPVGRHRVGSSVYYFVEEDSSKSLRK